MSTWPRTRCAGCEVTSTARTAGVGAPPRDRAERLRRRASARLLARDRATESSRRSCCRPRPATTPASSITATEQSQIDTIRAAGLDAPVHAGLASAPRRRRRTPGCRTTSTPSGAPCEHIGGPVNLDRRLPGRLAGDDLRRAAPRARNTLTIAGAPIDFHAGDAVIDGYVQALDASRRPLVLQGVVAAGGGVLKGDVMLGGFIDHQARERGRPSSSSCSRASTTRDHVERYRAFEDWYKHTQDHPRRLLPVDRRSTCSATTSWCAGSCASAARGWTWRRTRLPALPAGRRGRPHHSSAAGLRDGRRRRPRRPAT